MMHTILPLMAAESLLRDGTLRIRFDGAERDFLPSIHEGRFEYDFPIAQACWIRDLGTLPPTDFHQLIAETTSPEVTSLRPHIADYFEESFTSLDAVAENMPRTLTPDVESLDSFFGESLRVE